jgi:hypothetical protein
MSPHETTEPGTLARRALETVRLTTELDVVEGMPFDRGYSSLYSS